MWSLINNHLIKDIEKIKKALLMQQIQLNIIPFKPLVDNQTFAFYGEKLNDFAFSYQLG
jgi:hypothetical protein